MTVTLTSPDKLLWPAVGVTKADLAAYYEAVADRLLPRLAGRPLTLRRHPDGVDEDGFFQKHLPRSAPAWLAHHDMQAPSAKREVRYLLVPDTDHLRWLAQMAVVELHPMTVRADRDDRPDELVLDLDPPEGDRAEGPDVAGAAWWTREVLDDLGLDSLVTTTGKRGAHVIVPIERRYGFDEVRGLLLSIARATAARHPDALTVEMRKDERGDRLLVDWSRGGAAQTVIAPWSPRATPDASVALPLSWDEVRPGAPLPRVPLPEAGGRADPWPSLAPQRLERAVATVTGWGFAPHDRSPRARTG